PGSDFADERHLYTSRTTIHQAGHRDGDDKRKPENQIWTVPRQTLPGARASVLEPAHLGWTVEVEQKAEPEVDGPVRLDELAGRIGERRGLLERVHGLVI